MKYEVGDLLVARSPHWAKSNVFMIKKIIEINRSIDNGVWMESVKGYRLVNLNNPDLAFAVSEDQMDKTYLRLRKQDKK